LLLNFAGEPAEAAAYFQPRLLPLTLAEEEAQRLIDALGSEKESEWRAAFTRMRYFDPRLAMDLRTMMEEVEGEQRARLVDLLTDTEPGTLGTEDVKLDRVGKDQYDFESKGGSWGAEVSVKKLENGRYSMHKREWRRAARAIVLLAKIGTPGAMEIVWGMAGGNADALPTRVAVDEIARSKR
jgi:hypothetical protein